MRAAVDVLIALLLLMVGVWVAVFGSTNALLARARGRSAAGGFALGALLGPLAWAITLWQTRRPSIEVPAREPTASSTRSSSEPPPGITTEADSPF